ncbi:hypothetical protein BDR04DRAFT_1010931 [Suillus decipiens]|nr:hypothetical protein BDR04DRAFT_1010931 [Suillus decipiens]
MLFKSFFVATVAALAVNAQSGTVTSGSAVPTASGAVSPCILACSTQAAAQSDCISYTNLTCVCSSTAFQTAAGTCLQANCTAAEVAQANALQQDECATRTSFFPKCVLGLMITVSNSSSTTTSSSVKSSATTASSAKSSAATSSGAATGLAPSLALNSGFGGLVALAGILIGAALVV